MKISIILYVYCNISSLLHILVSSSMDRHDLPLTGESLSGK